MNDKQYFSAQNLIHDWETVCIDISFAAERGTMTTLVGPSGSGKSTVLRLIAGLEKNKISEKIKDKKNIRKEKIILDGKDITNTAPGKRGIGMVFQDHALFNHMKVNDNVAYGLRCKGFGKTESRKLADEYLEKFNLKGFGERWPQTLSGGEAQRVSLARTLIVEPKLVLFDEPLSALDSPLRKKLASDIRSFQKKTGFTGIWVTHDLEEAKFVSDTIIIIKDGHLKWSGKPEDFKEDMMSRP